MFKTLTFLAEVAPLDTDKILDSALSQGMTSLTGFITKMLPYVIGMALLGVGIGLVVGLIKKGGGIRK